MEKDETTVGHRLRGAIDGDVLITIRDLFVRQEPLATATIDDRIDPTVVTAELDAGLSKDSTGRFDIQWTIEGDYRFHYTEGERDFQWRYHPHDGDYDVRGYAHFHPPPDASSAPSDVQESCFTIHRPKLVTRGILKNWRAAYHEGTEALNNPTQTG